MHSNFLFLGHAMACVELSHLVEILDATKSSNSNRAKSIRDVICSSLDKISSSLSNPSNVFPYEVDGGDGKYFMDDANIPSLLSLPVLGYMSAAHPVYQATRAYVQSPKNPFWFSGTSLYFMLHTWKDKVFVTCWNSSCCRPRWRGRWRPSCGHQLRLANGYYNARYDQLGWWGGIYINDVPTSVHCLVLVTINVCIQIANCLKMLVKSSAGTGFMHESFNVNNVNDYTRWFIHLYNIASTCTLKLFFIPLD